MDFIDKIAQSGSDKEEIAREVIGAPEYIPHLVEGLHHKQGRIKFGCEKVLQLISEQQPGLLYPYFDAFVELLDSDNQILKWGAIIILSNLAPVDIHRKFEALFGKYYLPVTETAMITAANVIGNSWKIALAKPELSDKIAREILRAETATYENKGRVSPECNNVVYEHAIDSLGKFYDHIGEKKPVIDFIRRQLHNPRKPVAEKAKRFLEKYQERSEQL